MKTAAIAYLLSLCLSAWANEQFRVPVHVIEHLPTFNYTWNGVGESPVSCWGSDCAGYYTPQTSSADEHPNALLKLQLPDGRIVIATCYEKISVGLSALIAVAEQNVLARAAFRDCRVPASAASIDAEFQGRTVKLFMHPPGRNGLDKTITETYDIRGVLQPVKAKAAQSDASIQTIAALERFRTPELEKASEATPGTYRPTKGTVLTSPMQATVRIDGKIIGRSPLGVEIKGLVGEEHTITVEKEGWLTVATKIVADGKDFTLNLTLRGDGSFPQ